MGDTALVAAKLLTMTAGKQSIQETSKIIVLTGEKIDEYTLNACI